MVKYIKGNLLDDNLNFSVIGHQVNCLGVMGAGLAKQIKDKYSEVYIEYLKFCKKENPLGNVLLVKTHKDLYIANLFGQFSYSIKTKQTDYNALKSALIKLKNQMLQNNLQTLGLPYKLGCGLAGGDWENEVEPMIKEIFENSTLEIVIVTK